MNKNKMLSYILINIAVVLFVGGTYFLISQLKEKPAKTKEPTKQQTPLKKEKFNIPDIQAVESNSKISLQTTKKTYAKSEPINIQVVIESDNKIIDGAEFELKYNPSQIKIENINEGTFFPLYPKKDINSQKGTIRLIALQDAGDNKTVDNIILSTIQAKALKKGTVQLQFVKNKTHLAGYGGQELLQNINNLTLTIKQ